MARTKTLRQELIAHTETDLAHHAETKASIADLRKCVDKLTETVIDGFKLREELSVAKRKATIGDQADQRKTTRALGRKILLVLIGLSGGAVGAALHRLIG